MPPVILATLRKRMIALAGEIAEGMVFSGGSRAHMGGSLAVLPAAKRADPDFFIGNRIRTCVSSAFVQISIPPRAIEPLGRRRYWPV